LPPSAECLAQREAIEREVDELERLCGELERSLAAADFTTFANALRDSRRATHGFRNAMEAAVLARDAAYDATIQTRIGGVLARREASLERLRTYHAQAGERLQALSKWKVFARSVGAKQTQQKTIGFDSTH
jgi:AICAR transformylase/IMP cyclohydrolase PurH